MRRRLFAVFSALSMLVLAAALLAWPASHLRSFGASRGWSGDQGRFGRERGRWIVAAGNGRLLVSYSHESGRHLADEPVLYEPFHAGIEKNDPSDTWTYFSAGHQVRGDFDDLRSDVWSGLGGAYERFDQVEQDDDAFSGSGRSAFTRLVHVPFAYLVIVSAIAPAVWFRRRRKRLRELRRREMNLCRGCGYDLRASLHRCPECGRDAGAGKAASPS